MSANMSVSDTIDPLTGDDGFAAVGEVSGKMRSVSSVPTLDEPVMDTLRRDLGAIAVKVSEPTGRY
jgi:hypothetical protein